jgi:hypothetical protein
MNKSVDMKRQVEAMESQAEADQRQLNQRVGFWDGIGLNRRDSKRAVEGVDALNAARTQAVVNVGLTNIALTETKLRQGLVVGSMTAIGSLTMQVNSQTAAVMNGLSSGAAAEVISHMRNRHLNSQLVDAQLMAGGISREEADRIKALLADIAQDDVNRSVNRMTQSKNAVEALAEHATKGIEHTKDRLQ